MRRVSSVTLVQALALLPARLPVRLLKIDAQGVDHTLVLSAPPALLRRRVDHISLEVRSDECTPLYHGQAGCAEVVAAMATIGFLNGTRCPSPRMWAAGERHGRPQQEQHTQGCESQLPFANSLLTQSRPRRRRDGVPDSRYQISSRPGVWVSK